MQPVDNDNREKILIHKGNIVISASAGTGKTYTTIQRIIKDAEYNDNYKTFAAITFTRKAAKEIIIRLGPKKGEGFVGTNDNFILKEIIQPFMYDVYGREFKIKINPDFSDENQIDTYQEGIERIKTTQLMCKYQNNHMNFAFQLALYILKNSKSARRYMKAKYYRIYIDEYQDSDVDMHNFFMFLCDKLELPLFIVGDSKQSIYGWRGAYSDGFTGLFNKCNFTKFELWHNFRSNKVIQNFSNIFMDSVREHYEETNFNGEVIAYKFRKDIDATNYIKDWIDTNKKCAFLNFSNNNAEKWSQYLNNIEIPFAYIPSSLLDHSNLESEHIWISRALAKYLLRQRYSEYDFYDEIPMPEAYKIIDIKKYLKKIKELKLDKDAFESKVIELYEYLGYVDQLDKIKRDISSLIIVVNDEKYIPTYNQDKYKLTSGTIHSSKGLEFEQIIINASDYDFCREGIKFLHYVAVSRPEERLLIIAQNSFMDRYKRYIEDSVEKTRAIGKIINLENVIEIIE